MPEFSAVSSYGGTPPRVLYSATTHLGLEIASRYYGDYHYLWWSPNFGCAYDTLERDLNPTTSRPINIYRNVYSEASGGDEGVGYINRIKLGLEQAALYKYEEGVVDEHTRDEIISMVRAAKPHLEPFQPVICIVPFKDAGSYLKVPSVEERANVLSREYLSVSMPGDLFDKNILEPKQ